MDDITPFREITEQVQQSPVQLFKVKPAYRFKAKQDLHSDKSFVTGENPRYGASINYYLKDTVTDSVSVIILDDKGNHIKKIKGTNKQGVNRVWWNLGYD